MESVACDQALHSSRPPFPPCTPLGLLHCIGEALARDVEGRGVRADALHVVRLIEDDDGILPADLWGAGRGGQGQGSQQTALLPRLKGTRLLPSIWQLIYVKRGQGSGGVGYGDGK